METKLKTIVLCMFLFHVNADVNLEHADNSNGTDTYLHNHQNDHNYGHGHRHANATTFKGNAGVNLADDIVHHVIHINDTTNYHHNSIITGNDLHNHQPGHTHGYVTKLKAEVKRGRDARVNCVPVSEATSLSEALANEEVTFWWFNSDKHVVSKSKSSTTLQSGELVLKNVQPEDSGHYKCQVRNSVGEALKTYEYELLVYSLPSFTYDTVFTYIVSNPSCDPNRLNSKAESLWEQLCNRIKNKMRNCMYTIRPKCAATNATHHQWQIKVTANIQRNTVIENHPVCHGMLSCVIKKEFKRVKKLIRKERSKSHEYERNGLVFVHAAQGTSLNVHCRWGYWSQDGNICFPCHPGYFGTDGETPCQKCPQNTYNTRFGEDMCYKCPYGHVTAGNASSSVNACRTKSLLPLIFLPADTASSHTQQDEVSNDRTDRAAPDTSEQQSLLSSRSKLIAGVGAVTFMMATIILTITAFACCAGCSEGSERGDEDSLLTELTGVASTANTAFTEGSSPYMPRIHSHFTSPSSVGSVQTVYYEDLQDERLGFNHKQRTHRR